MLATAIGLELAGGVLLIFNSTFGGLLLVSDIPLPTTEPTLPTTIWPRLATNTADHADFVHARCHSCDAQLLG